MSIPYPLKHIDQYGEGNLDTPTLRTLLEHAKSMSGRNAHIRGEIVASKGEQFAAAEWDTLFQQEQDDYAEATRRIEAEFKKRNVRP